MYFDMKNYLKSYFVYKLYTQWEIILFFIFNKWEINMNKVT